MILVQLFIKGLHVYNQTVTRWRHSCKGGDNVDRLVCFMTLLHWFSENCFEESKKKWIVKHHFYHTSLLLKRFPLFSISYRFLKLNIYSKRAVPQRLIRESHHKLFALQHLPKVCVLLTLAVDKHLVGLLRKGWKEAQLDWTMTE